MDNYFGSYDDSDYHYHYFARFDYAKEAFGGEVDFYHEEFLCPLLEVVYPALDRERAKFVPLDLIDGWFDADPF